MSQPINTIRDAIECLHYGIKDNNRAQQIEAYNALRRLTCNWTGKAFDLEAAQ